MKLQYKGPAATFDASQRPGGRKEHVFTRDGAAVEVTKELGEDLIHWPGHEFVEASSGATPARGVTQEAAGNGTSTH